MLHALLFITLAPLTFLLAWQDFKYRLINVWIFLIYAAVCILNFLSEHPVRDIFENLVFSALYFLFCYCVLLLYFYLRSGQLDLRNKIGTADVLLLILLGCILSPETIIYFITFSSLLSLAFHLAFLRRNKQVPLAAYYSLLYFVLLVSQECGVFNPG